jgi:hypothetical protein
VHFVKPNALHRTSLSVGEDHGFADKLSLGLLEKFAEGSWTHGFSLLAWMTRLLVRDSGSAVITELK